MKFNVNQQDLQQALNYCQGVIEKRNTLPILSNVLLILNEGKLKIVPTDMDIVFYDEISELNIIEEYNNYGLKDVDWVVGCSMFLDLKNINMSILFDENFFFFYEETDLCRRIKNSGGIVLNSKRLIVNHLGQKSSIGSMKNKKLEAEKFRNWHLMWSEFYYHKKHNSFIFAFYKVFGKKLKQYITLLCT